MDLEPTTAISAASTPDPAAETLIAAEQPVLVESVGEVSQPAEEIVASGPVTLVTPAALPEPPQASTPQPKTRAGVSGTPRDVSRRRSQGRREPRPTPGWWLVIRRVAVAAVARGGPRVSRLVTWLLRTVVHVVTWWQRSLQVRVVSSTLVLGLAATAIVGAVIAEQIGNRLLDARREQAGLDVARAAAEFNRDMAEYADTTNNASSEANLLAAVQESLGELRGTGGDSAVGLALLRENTTAANRFGGYSTIPYSLIPDDLRKKVQDTETQQTRSIPLVSGDRTVPGLIIGQQVSLPVSAGAAELYVVVNLEPEQRTLDSIQRVLVAGLIMLVVMLAVISWLVSRQVADPIKEAALVAERLATGSLDERMDPRGQDDFATLAQSFNEMADSLQEQIEAMEELSRLQRRFVSDVSHELRTPLTTIRMAAEVIVDERDTFTPVVARSSELLSTQLDRFEALLADLLEISRFDAGAAALEAEDTDLATIARRVVDLAMPLAENKNAPLILHEPATPARAQIDSRRIERIVRNLVVNAVEHSEGKPVDVYVAADERTAAVLVVDHGIGLRPGDAERVFDRFWRADPARARTTGGTGLGLAISLEDARLHGGALRAWGLPDEGSRFLLTVPVVAGSIVGRSPLPLVPEGYDDPDAEPELPEPETHDPLLSDIEVIVADTTSGRRPRPRGRR